MVDQNTLLVAAGCWLLAVLVKGWMNRVDEGRKREVDDEIKQVKEDFKKLKEDLDVVDSKKVNNTSYMEQRKELLERITCIESSMDKRVSVKDCDRIHQTLKDTETRTEKLLGKMKEALILHTHEGNGKPDFRDVIL